MSSTRKHIAPHSHISSDIIGGYVPANLRSGSSSSSSVIDIRITTSDDINDYVAANTLLWLAEGTHTPDAITWINGMSLIGSGRGNTIVKFNAASIGIQITQCIRGYIGHLTFDLTNITSEGLDWLQSSELVMEDVAFINVPDGVWSLVIKGLAHDAYTYGWQTSHNNKLSEITVTGVNSSSTGNGIRVIDSYRTSIVHSRMQDVGVGVQWETLNDWCEKPVMFDVEIFNPVIGIKCLKTGGTGSLARANLTAIEIDLRRAGAVGFQFPDGMLMDRSVLDINVWINQAGTTGVGTTGMSLAGEMDGTTIFFACENFVTTNPPYVTGLWLKSTFNDSGGNTKFDAHSPLFYTGAGALWTNQLLNESDDDIVHMTSYGDVIESDKLMIYNKINSKYHTIFDNDLTTYWRILDTSASQKKVIEMNLAAGGGSNEWWLNHHTGLKDRWYSDEGSTLKAEIDGSSGNAQFIGSLTVTSKIQKDVAAESLAQTDIIDAIYKWVYQYLTYDSVATEYTMQMDSTVGLAEGDTITIMDDVHSETNVITDISGSTITVQYALDYAYTVPQHAKVVAWKPEGFTTPTSALIFKDTTTTQYVNVYPITVSDDNDNPLLVFDQGIVMKKDLAVGGFVASEQGCLFLKHGLINAFDPPKIVLSDSEDYVESGNTALGYFDTLHIMRADGVTHGKVAAIAYYATFAKLAGIGIPYLSFQTSQSGTREWWWASGYNDADSISLVDKTNSNKQMLIIDQTYITFAGNLSPATSGSYNLGSDALEMNSIWTSWLRYTDVSGYDALDDLSLLKNYRMKTKVLKYGADVKSHIEADVIDIESLPHLKAVNSEGNETSFWDVGKTVGFLMGCVKQLSSKVDELQQQLSEVTKK